MSPHILKHKLIAYIAKTGKVSYDDLMQRGVKRNGYEPTLMEAAITLLHRDKCIKTSHSGDVIFYEKKAEVKAAPLTHVEWVRDNYPPYDPWCVDEAGKMIMPFPEIDLSHLFLRGEDLERYKAESKGRVYIPGKKPVYERKAEPAPELSYAQQQVMDLFGSM